MSIEVNQYLIAEETYLKAEILSRGVIFSERALAISLQNNAKKQNLVYNMPLNATSNRPQELLIRNVLDQYEVVVSCVSTTGDLTPVQIEASEDGFMYAVIDNKRVKDIEMQFVKEPEYYKERLLNGESVKKYISACGLDELNIIPWKGCAISKSCKFCGINNFINVDELSAHSISKNIEEWTSSCEEYLSCLEEAITIALQSQCYENHAHVILIAGNLENDQLDLETKIFSDIAARIKGLVDDVSNEGIVAVITPPRNMTLIKNLYAAGVQKVVFNLEAITETGFQKYCPGKSDLGYDYFVDRLKYAVDIFGKGNVWTNLVFGLEEKEEVLTRCLDLIHAGIVISANVLHLDKGNTLDCNIPKASECIDFFYRLDRLNTLENFVPFYCAKALRTSLSNEAHDGRIKEIRA